MDKNANVGSFAVLRNPITDPLNKVGVKLVDLFL